MSTRTLEILLYKRPGCCLCDEMLAVVEALRSEFPLDLRCVDVSEDPDLEQRFGQEIPVLYVGGRKAFKYRVTPEQLRERLRREPAHG